MIEIKLSDYPDKYQTIVRFYCATTLNEILKLVSESSIDNTYSLLKDRLRNSVKLKSDFDTQSIEIKNYIEMELSNYDIFLESLLRKSKKSLI